MIFRDTSKISNAIEFVSQRHPSDASDHHFFHLLDVARTLSDATEGKDEDLVISGLLHHTVESNLVSREELSHHFNKSIAGLVSEVTDLRSRIAFSSRLPDSGVFQHYSDRTKMLFAADMLSLLNTCPNAHQFVGPRSLTEDISQTAAALSTCISGVNSVLEGRFQEVFKLKREYRPA